MSDTIASAGSKIFELFGACAASPDDGSVGEAADEALWHLEKLLDADGLRRS